MAAAVQTDIYTHTHTHSYWERKRESVKETQTQRLPDRGRLISNSHLFFHFGFIQHFFFRFLSKFLSFNYLKFGSLQECSIWRLKTSVIYLCAQNFSKTFYFLCGEHNFKHILRQSSILTVPQYRNYRTPFQIFKSFETTALNNTGKMLFLW